MKAAQGKGWADPAHPQHHPGSGPPRGYSRPPFETGNTVNLTHGARHPDTFEPIAQEITTWALETVPHLRDPAYIPAVQRWSVAEAKCQLLDVWLQKVGILDADGKPRSALDQLRQWQKRASEESDRLGLTPLARARLGRDASATEVNLATIWAEMARRDRDAGWR